MLPHLPACLLLLLELLGLLLLLELELLLELLKSHGFQLLTLLCLLKVLTARRLRILLLPATPLIGLL